jgi:3-phenylpropionate/trans-cinnamate dioxygenase ferredoxin reductase subunit
MGGNGQQLRSVVVVGAGHGGFTVASELRAEGFDGSIVLLDESESLPYQRPPLSKAYLNGDLDDEGLAFRGESYYEREGIELLRGESVHEVDRSARKVFTSTGRALQYDALVLATGAATIRPPWVDTSLIGMIELRTDRDAARLHRALRRVKRVVVVGGGFVGLEVACAARKHDLSVEVIEMQDRLMSRAVGPTLSTYVLESLRSIGIRVRLGVGVVGAETRDGRVHGVHLSSGEFFPSDVVVVGLGVRPRTELAARAGLEIDNGVVVNEYLQTSDPAIYAIGDCCSFPYLVGDGRRVRLESVQNATDQARNVARTLTTGQQPYTELPWFWSNQGGLTLQMAGCAFEHDREEVLGDRSTGRFSVLRFADGRLVCGESVNNTREHVALRTVVAHGDRDDVLARLSAPDDLDLRDLARSLRAKA